LKPSSITPYSVTLLWANAGAANAAKAVDTASAMTCFFMDISVPFAIGSDVLLSELVVFVSPAGPS
jgi:hypothetical protein